MKKIILFLCLFLFAISVIGYCSSKVRPNASFVRAIKLLKTAVINKKIMIKNKLQKALFDELIQSLNYASKHFNYNGLKMADHARDIIDKAYEIGFDKNKEYSDKLKEQYFTYKNTLTYDSIKAFVILGRSYLNSILKGTDL